MGTRVRVRVRVRVSLIEVEREPSHRARRDLPRRERAKDTGLLLAHLVPHRGTAWATWLQRGVHRVADGAHMVAAGSGDGADRGGDGAG